MIGGIDPALRIVLGRCLAAVLLGRTHLALLPGPPPVSRHRVTAGVVAAAAPVTSIVWALRRTDSRWSPPRTAAGRVLLLGYVGSGVIVEELLWRAPLLHLPPGRRQRLGALASLAAFSALHLHRDGLRSAPVHLSNTAGWTLATVLDRRVHWSLVMHTVYNLAALSIGTAGPPAHPIDPPGGEPR